MGAFMSHLGPIVRRVRNAGGDFVGAFLGLLVGLGVIWVIALAALAVAMVYSVHPTLAILSAVFLAVCAFMGWRGSKP